MALALLIPVAILQFQGGQRLEQEEHSFLWLLIPNSQGALKMLCSKKKKKKEKDAVLRTEVF